MFDIWVEVGKKKMIEVRFVKKSDGSNFYEIEIFLFMV